MGCRVVEYAIYESEERKVPKLVESVSQAYQQEQEEKGDPITWFDQRLSQRSQLKPRYQPISQNPRYLQLQG